MSAPGHRCCAEFTRSELAPAVAEAGRGLPSIEPGMPAPAGTGMTRRSLLLRGGALALSVYGASMLRPQAFVEGIARAAGSQGKVLVSVFLEGGSTPSRSSPRSTTTPTGGCGRSSGCAPAPVRPGPRTPACSGIPSATPLHQLHGEGKVTVFPGIGYTNADQSHFTSRHYWEVGESARAPTPGGSAGCSTSSVTTTTRFRDCRSTARSHRASHRAGTRRGDLGSELRALGAGRLGRCRGADVRELRADGRGGRGLAGRRTQRRRPGRPSGRAPAQAAQGVLGRDRLAGRLPRLRALLREPRRTCGDARRRAADQGRVGRRAGQLRHPRRADRLVRRRPRTRPATGSSPSSATSRPAASTTGC